MAGSGGPNRTGPDRTGPMECPWVRRIMPFKIAFSTQFSLEKTVIKCVKSLSKKKINLVLAGGVFANVKLNQKIAVIFPMFTMYICLCTAIGV